MADRYPSQDLSDSLEGYLWDYQELALKYSLVEVRLALAEWRITPDASFFPRPDEIAKLIEIRRESQRASREAIRQSERRKAEIAEFWAWATQWMADTGNDEEELMRRFPAMRGTKPETVCSGMTSDKKSNRVMPWPDGHDAIRRTA
jgi:hypothetical protein